MTYSQLIDRLFQVNFHGGIKLGLQNALKLQSLLAFPDQSFKTIHIAGTNGKGSVATKIALALSLSGYRVGLYTSPHLSCFRERIRINGTMISEKMVEKHLPGLFALCEMHQIPATFFELTTFLAFQVFAAEKVDIAVIETGLGGRFDATNVITPILSVITSISLDHTEILGMDIESITKEKAGIIKPKVPIIIGPTVPSHVVFPITENLHSPCLQVTIPSASFEEENCLIANKALHQLKHAFQLNDVSVQKALDQGRQPCRFEIVKHHPHVILDVAHNPDGLTHLFQALHKFAPTKRLRIIFGLSKNKDVQACLRVITNHGDFFHLVEAPNGRGIAIDELAIEMKNQQILKTKFSTHASISQAIEQALSLTSKSQELLVICGSFFIMSEARLALGYTDEKDLIDLNEKGFPITLKNNIKFFKLEKH